MTDRLFSAFRKLIPNAFILMAKHCVLALHACLQVISSQSRQAFLRIAKAWQNGPPSGMKLYGFGPEELYGQILNITTILWETTNVCTLKYFLIQPVVRNFSVRSVLDFVLINPKIFSL